MKFKPGQKIRCITDKWLLDGRLIARGPVYRGIYTVKEYDSRLVNYLFVDEVSTCTHGIEISWDEKMFVPVVEDGREMMIHARKKLKELEPIMN